MLSARQFIITGSAPAILRKILAVYAKPFAEYCRVYCCRIFDLADLACQCGIFIALIMISGLVDTLPFFQKSSDGFCPTRRQPASTAPKMANAQIRFEKGQSLKHVKKTVNQICAGTLTNISQYCLELAAGKYPVC
jgi:hypothetical protein